ncbi:hypothetical protein ANN_01892, partial [Periplaneta americana]
MSPGSSTESYPAFARIGLRENPGKNLNQVTCPDRDSNPGHLVSQPDALTVTPQPQRDDVVANVPPVSSLTSPSENSADDDVFIYLFIYTASGQAPEFIPQGATVDKILYKEILGLLSNSIRRKRPELWHRKNWMLLHDNAPAHRSIPVQEELARQQHCLGPECISASQVAVFQRFVDDVATLLGISHGSVQSILHNDLKMQRVCEHAVPRSLTDEQREERQLVSGDLIDQDPTLLHRVITGDKTWCFLCDPQPKRQFSMWKSPSSPRQKRFRADRSKGKVMLEVFFDIQGLVHFQNWFFHHDNAPAHRSLLVSEFLAQHKIPVHPQPPYSPDLAPAVFYSFPKVKSLLTMYCEEYNACSSVLCNFLHSPVTSSLLAPNIFLSTLFLNTLNLCCPLKVIVLSFTTMKNN